MATSTAETGEAPSGTTAAIVLAAGGGRRFSAGTHKLRASFRGRPLVAHAVEAAVEAGLDEVIVVVGAVDVADALPPGVTVVENTRWSEGQAGSVVAGIAAAERSGHAAVVVGLGDQPLIGPGPWRSVAASAAPIAVATYGGRRRNPVRLSREVWALLPREGDAGARVIMGERPDLVGEVPCQGSPVDIDTLEDLERWN